MSHIQYVDELIREYLLYRGFSNSLKIFDSELKTDKDKGFRVDKIVEQFMQFVYTYDLASLRELWCHLDQKMFARLEHNFSAAIRKLESSVLKWYLVHAIVNGKHDKVSEFFTKMTPELQCQPEWRDWFILPFIKNPDENPSFAVHFTRQWQDTLLVSLHNLLSTIFQCMPQPTLSYCEEESSKLKRLQEENEILKLRLSGLSERNSKSNSSGVDIIVPETSYSMQLMDDYYIIAQENATLGVENPNKTLKTLIRNIGGGLPTSPILGRKLVSTNHAPGRNRSIEEQHKRHNSRHRQCSAPSSCTLKSNAEPKELSKRQVEQKGRTMRDASIEKRIKPSVYAAGSKILLLGQEEFIEHKSAIIQCKYNNSGSMVVSSDADNYIKLWTTAPNSKTLSTFISEGCVTSLDWVSKNERYFLTGTKNGCIRLYDSQESRMLWELGDLKDTRISCISCNPAESTFVTSLVDSDGQNKLLLYDIKTKKQEGSFSIENPLAIANCCTFNHNGQLLITGFSDGLVKIYDLRNCECIDSWLAHKSPIVSIQLTSDDTQCFSLGQDGKLCQRSLNKTDKSPNEYIIPNFVPLNISGNFGRLFALDPSGSYCLVCGTNGGNVYNVSSSGLNCALELGGHSSQVVTVDWATANQCATCLTASVDGIIIVSTLLMP